MTVKFGWDVNLDVDVYVTVTLKCSVEIFRKRRGGGGEGEAPKAPTGLNRVKGKFVSSMQV